MTKVLMLIRCEIDDIPLKLYGSIAEAENDAAMLKGAPKVLEGAMEVAADIMNMDISEPLAIALVTFANEDMLSMRVVADLSS